MGASPNLDPRGVGWRRSQGAGRRGLGGKGGRMITPVTFLGCPAYIDTHAKMRCGLPAAVTCRTSMCLGRAFLDRMPCPLSVNSVQREAQPRGRTIARMHDHGHPWTSCRDWPVIVRAGRSDPEDHSPHHFGIPGHLGKPPLEEGGCLIPCGASAYAARASPRGEVISRNGSPTMTGWTGHVAVLPAQPYGES